MKLRMPFALLLAVLLCAAVTPLNAQSTTWTLVWSDEFNGKANSALDPAEWGYDTGGGGWGNNELETYTNSHSNSYQDGQGNLVIKAIKQGSTYTSARLKTQGLYTFTYGKCEARIKIPYGQGMWPAFWMLGSNIGSVGWPLCGEIDIMENIGREPSADHGSAHGSGYDFTSTYSLGGGQTFAANYHLFGIEWDPEQIRYYVDGALYGTYSATALPAGKTWTFNHPYFLLLNVAVGGSWPGSPDGTTVFPQMMLVDYVRVYKASRPGSIAYLINAGGSAASGYETDTPYVDSGSGASTAMTLDTHNIYRPAPTAVLQTERYGANFTYTLLGLKPNTLYSTRLTFGEGYWTQPNQRIQNVAINGTPVLTNFILPPAQNNIATMTAKTFAAQADSSGTLKINFAAAANSPDLNAEVRAIEVSAVSATNTDVVYQVNSGGDTAGTFAPDAFYTGGTVPAASNAAIDVSGVVNPAPQAVYQSERYGNQVYTFPALTPGAAYRVHLHFAEFHWTKPGQRVFNVLINGVPALSGYDIVASVGAAQKADIKEFNAVADSSGQITVQYQSVVDSAKSSGIEILATAAASGSITFEGIAANAAAQTVAFTFRPTDNSGSVTQTLPVSPPGAFTLIGLPRKAGILHVKGDNYLAANVSVDATNGNVSGVTATLAAGDATNNNVVNFDDFLVLLNAFGASAANSGSGYDVTADFNGDGIVNFDDFLLLLNNFGLVGAP